MLELEFGGRSQRAEDLFFCFVLSRKLNQYVMWSVLWNDQTPFMPRFLFAFSFLSYLVYASQYWSPAIVGDQGDFEVCCPITFLPHSHILSLCWCTVDNIQRIVLSFVGVRSIYQCSFLGIALYISSVLFFSCVKVSLWPTSYAGIIESCILFDVYCSFCTLWLICTPTSSCPLALSINVGL